MITVTAEFRINDGKEAEAVAAIEKVVAAVNADEPGALTYTWHRDIKDAARILVYEVWADEEATKLHRETESIGRDPSRQISTSTTSGSIAAARTSPA